MNQKISRTVLVIEDNELNREVLCEILSPYYRVIQAENGKQGLELLSQNRTRISLILLDIQMPVMNGYEFLDAIRDEPQFAQIPIIVTTSSASATDEIKCLDNGASDFVSKPYNTDVVLKRVESMIRLRENTAVINKVEYDELTGVYSKEFFFMNAESVLEANPDTAYDMLCGDINAFQVINDRYGIRGGNALLICVADALKSQFRVDSVCGRVGTNTFAVLTPHRDRNDYVQVLDAIHQSIKASESPNAVIHIGIYPNVVHDSPAIALCDRAFLALEEIRHQYGNQIAEFSEQLRDQLIRRQMILDSVETALEEGQFSVYYQPKHSLAQNATGGAEALIRWNHPELGMISPGDFIPLCEKHGLITKLDYYVLDRVCRDLQGWLSAKAPVVPISLNFSRVDFNDPNLVQIIEQTAQKYGIPHNLLHPEVTESAYTEDTKQFLGAIEKLRALGFRVELDDFGSGYSSLTVLNDMEMDVLKLDMSLVRNLASRKQKLILKRIFCIAQDLGMETVAEGVETKEQSDELRKMGCTYAQGYYYAKPMRKAEFEAYLRG